MKECGGCGGDIRAALARSGAIGPSWSVMRTAMARAVGGFDPSFHNCNDWDFYVLGPDGESVGSAATLDNPEVVKIPDPVPGTYTVVAENYAGGDAEHDWTGEVTFQSPEPPQYSGIKEAWQLTCTNRRGKILGSREVVIDRGETVNVGNACQERKRRR